MPEEYRAKIFKSGNSLALRLPKALGLKEGAEMIVREERTGFTVQPADAGPRKVDLSGIWGVLPDIPPLAPEERQFAERPLDWDGSDA